MTSICSILVITNLCCTDNFKFSILYVTQMSQALQIQNASKLIFPPLLFYFSLSDLVNSNLWWPFLQYTQISNHYTVYPKQGYRFTVTFNKKWERENGNSKAQIQIISI